MKRLFGVPRMLSMTTTPLTEKRLSNDCAPEIVKAAFGPFWLTPGESATAERSVRPVGSVSSWEPVNVVAAWVDVEIGLGLRDDLGLRCDGVDAQGRVQSLLLRGREAHGSRDGLERRRART